MITDTFRLAGEPVDLHFVEDSRDAADVLDFVARNPVRGIDTETPGGFNVYRDRGLRLLQVGNGRESYSIPIEEGERFAQLGRDVIRAPGVLLIQNADFDLPVIEVNLGIPLEETYPRTLDTKILSILVDPLGVATRGAEGKLTASHKLKDLCRKHVDPELDIDRTLTAEFRRLKMTKATGWAGVELRNEVYRTYAGLDPILAFRIFETLKPRLVGPLRELLAYEHRIAYLLTTIKRRGLLADVPYTEAWLDARRQEVAELLHPLGRRYGICDTADGTAEAKERVFAMLRDRNVPVGQTAKGGDSLAKNNLGPAALADEVVGAYFRAKELTKFGHDYAQKFLDLRDEGDVIHPVINSLGAITSRNSIELPPLQQMPQLYEVRGCLRARPGTTLVGADFDQVEFRVAAALSGEPAMIELIRQGVDLHGVVAGRLYPGFDPKTDLGKKQRTIAKRAGFGRIYGAGPAAVAKQTSTSLRTATAALEAFDAAFPGIKRWAKELGRQTEIVTVLGRTIPIDPVRPYAAVNYAVQGEARDVFMAAGLRLADAGLAEHLWLPIHDEWIVEVPEEDGEEVAKLAADNMTYTMTYKMRGVPVSATGEIMGERWRKLD